MIAWKDPRLSLLLPFWRDGRTGRDDDRRRARSRWRSRHRSRYAAYAVGAAQAAALWLRYVFAATAADPGHLLVRHTDLFDDLPATIGRLAAHVGLPAPDASTAAAVREHLDLGLRHHDAASAPAGLDNPLLEVARAVWNDGDVDLGAVSPAVADLLGRGWLRPPEDGELLARARADVVRARETLRKTNQRVKTLEAQLAARDESP